MPKKAKGKKEESSEDLGEPEETEIRKESGKENLKELHVAKEEEKVDESAAEPAAEEEEIEDEEEEEDTEF